jgi:hypothetical protein
VEENDNYALDLPSTMKIHPTFHVSKLRAYLEPEKQLQRRNMRPEAIKVDGEEQYEVDRIVRHRMRRNKKQYLIKWTGYDNNDNTWEDADEVTRYAARIVKRYENSH